MKYVHLFICMVLLSGCMSTPPNPVSSDIRNALRITSVEVIWSVKPDDDEPETLENFNANREDMIRRIETEVLSKFAKSPNGAVEAKFVVNVIGFQASKATVVRNKEPRLVLANVTLKRRADGNVLGVYDAIVTVEVAQSGLVGVAYESAFKSDLNQALAKGLAANLRERFFSPNYS